jgi:hypothetical protein
MRYRCPNPLHSDDSPSCTIYPDHAYCFSKCGWISREQYFEWTGVDLATLPCEESRTTTSNRDDTGQSTLGRINYYHRTLMVGPRSERVRWFYERGFTLRQCKRYRFGHTGTHFCIPIWNADEILGFKLRRDEVYCDPDEVKYKNQKGMGVKTVRPNPTGSPTVVVEGELDAYLLSTWGIDSLSTTSGAGSLSGLQSILQSVPDVYILPDNDDAGEEGANNLSQTAPDRFHIIRLPDGFGDVTDYLVSFQPEERAAALRRLFNARPNTAETSG